jgi:hypothetical protein
MIPDPITAFIVVNLTVAAIAALVLALLKSD